MTDTRTFEVDSFVDAFGERVYVGDTVVYVAGGRASRELKRGRVLSIKKIEHTHPPTRYRKEPYVITEWSIPVRFAPKSKTRYGTVSSGVSPLSHPERIAKWD